MNTIDFTPLAEAVIAVLALVISTYLIPWIKTRLSAEQLAYARAAVDVAVYAAEKAYGAGKGEEKLKYVEDVLAARGIALDTTALASLVDSAIKKMEQAERGGVTIIEQIGDVATDDGEDHAEVS